ncbi:MAG: hypothetical protein ACOC3I_06590 [Verrucomicrobiota bacterium]
MKHSTKRFLSSVLATLLLSSGFTHAAARLDASSPSATCGTEVLNAALGQEHDFNTGMPCEKIRRVEAGADFNTGMPCEKIR